MCVVYVLSRFSSTATYDDDDDDARNGNGEGWWVFWGWSVDWCSQMAFDFAHAVI